MISWETCKEDFRWDGSLRDIYVTPATLNDWRVIYPLLRDAPGVKYSVDGIAKQIPASVEESFVARQSANPLLYFRVGPISVCFHFFSEEEIECDVDPRDIGSQSDLDALLGFVSQLADAVRKPIIITPENSREYPFITYEPETRRFQYHEAAR